MNIRKPSLKPTLMLAELLTTCLLFSGTLHFCFKGHIATTLAVALLWSEPFFVSLYHFYSHPLWQGHTVPVSAAWFEAFWVWIWGVSKTVLCWSEMSTFPYSGHSCLIVWKNYNEKTCPGGWHCFCSSFITNSTLFSFPPLCFWKYCSSE